MKASIYNETWKLFFGDNQELIEVLKKVSTIKTYSHKEVVLTEQEQCRDVFLVLTGKVRAFSLTVDGTEIWLETIYPGTLFGEISALGSGSRSASIVAKEKSAIARIKGSDFVWLMEEYGSIGLSVSRKLVERIERTTRRLCELTSLSAPERVYAELLRLSDFKDSSINEECTIAAMPHNTELATYINSTRETVSRTLSKLEKNGVIKRKNNELTITSPNDLIKLINSS